jgi:hypothetical protein
MKGMNFLITLLCMILITASVSAVEEMNQSVDLNLTDTQEPELQVSIIQKEPLFSPEASMAFGAVEKKILMITEEAFEYLLLGDETTKQEFLDEYASLTGDLASFEQTFDINSENASEFKEKYDQIVASSAAMGTTAEKMFASYETNQLVVLEDVIAFEEEVDKVTKNVQEVWDLHSETNTSPISLNSIRSWLMSTLLEAIEETYAYPVLGDEVEKQDALAQYASFDEVVAMGEDLYPDESFDELKTIKTDLLKAAETIFATYEADGTVKADEVAVYDEIVEVFNDEFLVIVLTGVSDTGIVVEEPTTVTLIESEVNATA